MFSERNVDSLAGFQSYDCFFMLSTLSTYLSSPHPDPAVSLPSILLRMVIVNQQPNRIGPGLAGPGDATGCFSFLSPDCCLSPYPGCV